MLLARLALILLTSSAVLGAFAFASAFGDGTPDVDAGEASSTPIAGDYVLAMDCDLNTPGIQDSCTNFTGAATRTVGIVFVNESASDFRLSSFDIRVISPDASTLNPQPGIGLFDGNPDFADDSFVSAWNCGVADNDTGENGPGTATSYLGCFTLSSTPELVGPSEQLLLGTIDYDVPALAPPGTTALSFGQMISVVHSAITSSYENHTCTPSPESTLLSCLTASLTLVAPPPGSTSTPTATSTASPTVTATPTVTPAVDGQPPSATPVAPFFLAFDCDVNNPGLQTHCTYPHSTSFIDVDVVLTSNASSDDQLSAFNFIARNDNRALLVPLNGLDGNYDANPDFNEAVLPGNWTCALPAPSPDTGALGPTGSASFLSCFISGAGNVPLAAGQSIALARVHYAVSDPDAGTSLLDFDFVSAGDPFGVALIQASPGCPDCLLTATIDIAPPPTATPTPPGPRVEKIPEGNANNVDLTAPAANLWICAAGPCDGPGEGELIVFEYATNVQTGDQDGDTIADGLGAYEFSVEYDNFVIASLNAQDVVFSTGPVAPYPGGADGAADGEGASRAPATCDMSIVTENIVHFGCVTAGQT
ncbi:MAG TPA: hypothetical protein VFH62_04115, partial [Dehalococcoidia bacterium]|nr:hypothetical protein [Dehalococcoidia bacterium]